MRILLLNTAYPPPMIGGAEKAVSLLAEALARLGHTVHVAAKYQGKTSMRETINQVEVTRFPIDNLYWPFGKKSSNPFVRALWHIIDMWNLRSARRLGQLMDEFKPDVLHTHNPSGFSVAVWAQARKRGIRVVHTMHDYALFCPRSTAFRHGKRCATQCSDCRLFSTTRLHASADVDSVISVSGRTLQLHREHGYFTKTRAMVLNNICPLDNHAASSTHPGGPAEPLRFGYIGRITEEKGIETLLQATCCVSVEGWLLRIAGAGDKFYEDALKARFPDPRIVWLGYVAPSEFYRLVDVVVLPSIWEEPMPYSALESLSAGKQIIASSVGGIPEALAWSQQTTFFEGGNVEELRERIEEALLNSGGAAIMQASDTVLRLSGFSEAAVIEKHLAIYAGRSA